MEDEASVDIQVFSMGKKKVNGNDTEENETDENFTFMGNDTNY